MHFSWSSLCFFQLFLFWPPEFPYAPLLISSQLKIRGGPSALFSKFHSMLLCGLCSPDPTGFGGSSLQCGKIGLPACQPHISVWAAALGNHTVCITCFSSQGPLFCFLLFSVTKSCLTLCSPLDYSTSGFPVLLHLPEFTQTHVHWVSDGIQPSHLLLPPSLPALNLSQHQGLFQWVGSSHQVAKVLELHL